MRHRLPLIAAACALPGAALPPDATLQSVYECRAGYQASLDLTASMTASREVGTGTPPNRTFNRYLEIPDGFRPYGLTPTTIGTSTGQLSGRPVLTLIIVVSAPYQQVEAAVLAANGLTACPDRSAGTEANCTVFMRLSEPERPFLRIKSYGDRVAISCAHMEPEA